MWRSIDCCINYQISNIGNVRNANTGRILKTRENRDGYMVMDLRTDGKKQNVKIHRLVAKAFVVNAYNKTQVDHIDNDKKNNCANNLRWATHQDNQRNKPKTLRPTTSKYIGVCWAKSRNRWVAKIRLDTKTTHIGCFYDPKDAARAYNQKLISLATEFGFLNEISDSD